jgi:hypothetical protein
MLGDQRPTLSVSVDPISLNRMGLFWLLACLVRKEPKGPNLTGVSHQTPISPRTHEDCENTTGSRKTAGEKPLSRSNRGTINASKAKDKAKIIGRLSGRVGHFM